MDKKTISKKFIDLLEIVEKLRGPNGCPWDQEQTHETLLPYFLEETYEVMESIDGKNWDTLEEELGDILLHVVMQAQISKENERFNIYDSLNNVNDKLIRRHPHVFGDKNAEASFHAKQNWEAAKHKEKGRSSRLDGVPSTLPALLQSQRLQEKASYVGFDWENIDDVWNKMHEEINELRKARESENTDHIREEIGDVLFTIINVSRFLGVSGEDALRRTNQKFIHRFQAIEKELKLRGKTIDESSLEEMNKIWDTIKKDDLISLSTSQ